MAGTEVLLNAFVTLLVTLDPPGMAPLFLGLTRGMNSAERKKVALRGSLIALGILTVFALFGNGILGTLGISIGAFRIAGGLMLFFIAFEMIFEKRHERKEKTTEKAITDDHIENIAVFPLALPLIAGPGSISATILISGSLSEPLERAALILVIAVSIFIVFAAMMIADRIDRFLGSTGRAILTRLLGVILAALSVQFVVDGIKSAFHL
ncbi:MarC family protein [Allorhizobium sp. BGMRC 0089]|uniref:MarC family protein n=1 Tax=Allorhizobium sonneratiae TaxID=2934936 RepID=UPI00203324D6|nr:MarC family protein [Allorhizobium sonneratiae]MCM2292814.1 MarC family protein [Allorhizobium sonneratiae]